MQRIKDIRPIKRKLREKCKQSRREFLPEQKSTADRKIRGKLLNLWLLRNAKTVLVYVSTEIEVDTRELISELFLRGVTVAVPKCEDAFGNMSFYIIRSFDELKKGFFGVLEPEPSQCEKLTDFSDSVCIVPAFMFDKKGFRLGYGKGYYDRFLADFPGTALGICYNGEVCERLYHGRFDRPVDMIVTDRQIIDNRVIE